MADRSKIASKFDELYAMIVEPSGKCSYCRHKKQLLNRILTRVFTDIAKIIRIEASVRKHLENTCKDVHTSGQKGTCDAD